jgi:predicted Zn-dependent protease
MLQEADYLEIDRYLDGLMTDDEIVAFEIKVKENEVWRNALHKQQAKQQLHRKAFEKRMANRQKEPERRIDGLMPRLMILVAIGACIVAILLFVSPWEKNIYLQFSSKEMPLPDSASPLQHEAARAFNHRHFEAAIPLLDQQLAQQPTDTLAMLHKGISLMETGKITDARALLEKIADGHSQEQHEAAFYVALTYEQQHDRASAMTWLAKIPEGSSTYEKAQQMMQEIR